MNEGGRKSESEFKMFFFSLEKAQVAITTTYPKMLFVPQESVRREIVHYTTSCINLELQCLTQNIFFTSRGILTDIPILKKILTD